MRVVALISGGKDSCYNMMQCVAAGHQIVALANLRPAENTGQTDELDSYMYQTVGHHAIDLYADALDLPLYRGFIKGTSVNTGRVYTTCQEDEVEDLYHLMKLVKDKEGVEGVSVGAILSDYQRVRVEDVCRRLNLQPLAYLWRRKQEILLKEIISSNIQAIIIKVAAFGLDPDKHLGKTLDQMEPDLLEVGDVLYCAGQIALVPCTMQLVSGGICTEAIISLRHVERVLEAMSQKTALHHVITASCYVTDSKHIPIAHSIWQKKLRECKKVEDSEMYYDATTVCGLLAVVVISHLPRDAAIEWHVVAVVDDPLQRKHFTVKMLSEGFQIECESVESSSASCASISVRLSLISPSLSQLDLDGPLHDLVVMFRQAVEKLSEDCTASPLSFRAFFKEDVFDAETLQTGLQEYLEKYLGKKTPALILVPVVDLPGKEVIHITCWLS
uniref:Diphthine--ammonia ligase n=1 Tax=Aquila chrysaetos chrysaetos TaxID=223781 RepID=A0A663DR89_AQUCH